VKGCSSDTTGSGERKRMCVLLCERERGRECVVCERECVKGSSSYILSHTYRSPRVSATHRCS